MLAVNVCFFVFQRGSYNVYQHQDLLKNMLWNQPFVSSPMFSQKEKKGYLPKSTKPFYAPEMLPKKSHIFND